MTESKLLESIVFEYKIAIGDGYVNMDGLEEKLSNGHNWTAQGARTIVNLADNYGIFMLRNALALAIALNKEDGNLGF